MNDKEELESMKNAVRFMNLLIVTEKGYNQSRKDQIQLFKDEFGTLEEFAAAMLDTFINFVGTIALGTSFNEKRPVTNIEVLQAFRNGIADIIAEND